MMIAFTVLCLAVLLQPVSALSLFETKHGGELVDSLKLTTSAPYVDTIVYRLPIRRSALKVGDIVQVTAQMECTNGYEFNVMLAHYLYVQAAGNTTKDAPAIDKSAGAMIAPAYPAGENISPNMHHSVRTLSGYFAVRQDFLGADGVDVLLVAYAASDLAKAHDTIAVNNGYGGLSAVVHSS